MVKQFKRGFMILGMVTFLAGGVYAWYALTGSSKEAQPIQLTQEEKVRFEQLEKVKIITKEEIRGAISDTAFKVTGYEEKGMRSEYQIQDDYYHKIVREEDSFLAKKAKKVLNEWNNRELTANFSVDYGLGFNLEPIFDEILVDEYTGKVTIPTPELVLTNFYIDPTFAIQEENGALIQLFNREFTKEEKDLLLKKMEDEIKERILHNDITKQEATRATKERLTDLLQKINPTITVVFN